MLCCAASCLEAALYTAVCHITLFALLGKETSVVMTDNRELAIWAIRPNIYYTTRAGRLIHLLIKERPLLLFSPCVLCVVVGEVILS